MSAVAHYIAGVLPWEAMEEIIGVASPRFNWIPGDRVKTLRGSLHGIVVKVSEDGRILWRPDGTKHDLIAMPEDLCSDDQKKEPRS